MDKKKNRADPLAAGRQKVTIFLLKPIKELSVIRERVLLLFHFLLVNHQSSRKGLCCAYCLSS